MSAWANSRGRTISAYYDACVTLPRAGSEEQSATCRSISSASKPHCRSTSTLPIAAHCAIRGKIYCKTVWDRMQPHHPTLFRSDVPNPWEGETKKRREKKTKTHAGRDEVYQFAHGAVAAGKPELGAAAILAFEWFLRPSSIAAGFAQWSGYRSAAHPD